MRELGEIYKFYKTPYSNRAVVFYAEHEGYYPCFEGVIKKLTEEYGITISYITSDKTDPILKGNNAKIHSFYINKLLPYFLVYISTDVLIMTLTDLGRFHIKRSINNVHYMYMFHAMMSTHMVYLEGAFDYYDSILCTGPHQIAEIRKREETAHIPKKTLLEAGYYRLERIYAEYQKSPPREVHDRPTVLIAPSWGDENILESCGSKLVRLLLEQHYKVIVRPHPETVRRHPEILEALQNTFSKHSYFMLEESVATDNSLLSADILISDTSGITLEYAFGTERPVVFIDVPLKIKNKNFKDIGIEPLELLLRDQIGVVVSKKLDTLLETINNLLSQQDVYQKRIRDLRQQYVFTFGHSSEVGARYIADNIKKSPQIP